MSVEMNNLLLVTTSIKIYMNKKIPVGARFFAAVQTDHGAHPVSYTMGTGSLFRG
jgi:hypothetical protein